MFAFPANNIKSWSPNDPQNVWELSGLHEGDIMIHPDSPSWKNGLLDATARWHGGIVPYFIQEDDFGNLLSFYVYNIHTKTIHVNNLILCKNYFHRSRSN